MSGHRKYSLEHLFKLIRHYSKQTANLGHFMLTCVFIDRSVTHCVLYFTYSVPVTNIPLTQFINIYCLYALFINQNWKLAHAIQRNNTNNVPPILLVLKLSQIKNFGDEKYSFCIQIHKILFAFLFFWIFKNLKCLFCFHIKHGGCSFVWRGDSR